MDPGPGALTAPPTASPAVDPTVLDPVATVPAGPAAPAEPRWLDTREQRTWRSFLAATQLVMDRVDRQLQHESGVVHTYYEMLVRLSEAPGRTLRMSELAESSLASRSRVSHAVARLEERGWMRREACATDGRGYNAVLTDAGLQALADAAPGHVETVRELLFDRLDTEQQVQLQRICEVLLAHLLATGSVSPVPLDVPEDAPGPGGDALGN